jgi:hypothetical protein
MTKILAFSGRKQSGKSTSGEYLQSLIYSIDPKIDVRTYSFADPLKKNICIDLLGLTNAQCYGTDEDKNSCTSLFWENMPGYTGQLTGLMTAREVMEYVGTKMFRRMKDKIWVEATLNTIQKDNPDFALLLDNRFPNEVDPILDIGGYVIRLTRNPFDSSAEPEVALDPEQYDWTKFSCIIDNRDISIEQKNNLIHKFIIEQGILPL